MKMSKLGPIILFMLSAACDQQESAVVTADPLGPGRVATVNGVPVQESLFRLYALSGMQKNAEELTEEERDVVLSDLIRLRVMADAAGERGLLRERLIAAELELQRLQVIARSMALRYLEENPATEAELRAAYEENLPRFSNTQYKARHILLDSEEDASAVITELEGGADFVELARTRSTGPTAPQGGDLGWFSADSMVEPFADAVQAMSAGSYSEVPVQTRFGWHVILLEETRDQQPPGLEAVRADLTNLVDRRKLEAYVNGLRDAAEVVVGNAPE